MDFLVLMRAIEPMPIPPAEIGRLALKQLDYWDDLRARGKLAYTAPYVGIRARVAVYSADSNAELFDLINQDPLFPYLSREVIPLTDNDHLRELYQAMVAGSTEA